MSFIKKMHTIYLLFSIIQLINALPPIIKIGAIFSEDQKNSSTELAFKYGVYKVNMNKNILPKTELIFDIKYVPKDDSFHASKIVCSQIQTVQAIFGPSNPILGQHINSICDALDIPHLETRSDSYKGVKEFSINLHPAQYLFNTAFKDVINYLNWTKIAIVYEKDYGLIKLRELVRSTGIEIYIRQAEPDTYNSVLREIKNKEIHNLIVDTRPDHMTDFLKGILQLQMNEYKYHYLFTTFDIETFDLEDFKYNFVNITAFRLVDVENVGVREILKDMDKFYTNQNYTLFNRTKTIKTEPALMYDSVHVFAIGLQTLEESQTLRLSNVSCAEEKPWDIGLSLINYINAVEWKGLTGPMQFKEGRRIQFKLDLVKLKQHSIIKVGEWSPDIGLNISDRSLLFDAETINVTLVVITILEQPYVMMHYGKNYTGNYRFFGYCIDILDRIAQEVGFQYILDLVPDRKYGVQDQVTGEWNGMVSQLMNHETPYVMLRESSYFKKKIFKNNQLMKKNVNNQTNTFNNILNNKTINNNSNKKLNKNNKNSNKQNNYNIDDFIVNDDFEGFCIDLLRLISKMVGFEFKIELVPDGKYGVYDFETGEWNGIVRQLMDKKADLAVGSMTINYARESVIDFTKPFMNLGISILFKVPTIPPTRLFSFMNPLAVDIWLYVLAAYGLVSITMYIVARFSPYEWHNPHPCETDNDIVENQFTIANSFWFTIGTLMQQGSDLNPKAISTRIVGGIWWFFTLIIISSYTANLAAFLTVERMITPIEHSDDLAGQTEISYGTLESGSTMTFFRDSMIETYKKMWRFMENKKPSVFTTTYEEGIKRVLEGNYAFLMESTMLDYIVQRNCNLTQIGGLLDTKGYGIATPMGSPWRDKISLAILELQEKGEIQMLYDKWWKNTGDSCERTDKNKESKANALGVDNIGGVFVVLLCGLAFAVLVAIIEFCHNSKKNSANLYNMPRQSLCAEMSEELCFAVKCQGSRQRPALKRECSNCQPQISTFVPTVHTDLPDSSTPISSLNMSSLVQYGNVTNHCDNNYCCSSMELNKNKNDLIIFQSQLLSKSVPQINCD